KLLTEVRDQGSISQAAASVGLSYRHAWQLLREFDEQFGAALVQKTRGRGTVLSPLAEKLIWADKRIAARLSPMLDSLASELEQELAVLLATNRRAVRITASHGFAVAALINQMGEKKMAVDLKYRNSTEAVTALSRGECDLAGFHLPMGEFEPVAAAQYLKWINPRQHALIHLAYRMQGLFVAKGNPKAIRGLADLTRNDIRFVNRQHGSGTRMLLELFLAKHGIRTADIAGYESAEFTHAAVAAYVASDMADVSFGVEAAARRFDLDFIPIVRERYFFACDQIALSEPPTSAVRTIMLSEKYRSVVSDLAGYDAALSGSVVKLGAML
ncbi:MAG TPA: substrate-binding domain-containing protein, partial [Noviherbaspirillum sp.]|uniref:substrate-binding domain-containing protein n=1 Tax=Noviherbaspirillum sp. TaxID=1926288 RepID=UPI002B4A9F67